MDWASGHWPGIVHMCVWMCASCLGWGVVLWVRGNRHHGHGLQGPPGPLCPPRRGHMAWHPLTDPHTIGRQFTHQPSSLTPRWWQLARCPSFSVRQEMFSQLVIRVFSLKTLGTIKISSTHTHPPILRLLSTILTILLLLLYCTILCCSWVARIKCWHCLFLQTTDTVKSVCVTHTILTYSSRDIYELTFMSRGGGDGGGEWLPC